jgi:hypothetical protein
MASDVQAPKLVSISSSSSVINIDGGQTTVTVTARLTDNLSGLFDSTFDSGMGSSPPQIVFVRPSGQRAFGMFDMNSPISGGSLNGVYQARITLGSMNETHICVVERDGGVVMQSAATPPHIVLG